MNVLFSFKQLRTLLAMLAMMIFSFPDAVADTPSLIRTWAKGIVWYR